ncbi:hypothetical protein GQ53DRAFT_794641 [Thozetella sp. PMI_491]|nr:hypothetical protein GQ53DRAFT_794641 [Thozetella sp. PMI_491]
MVPSNTASVAEVESTESPGVSVFGQPHEEEPKIVCFGTVPDISARCSRPGSSTISSSFEVCLESSERFTAKDYPEICGRIMSTHGQMVQGLLDEGTLHLHVMCAFENESTGQKKTQGFSQIPCLLEITVYGPLGLFDEIGSWFEEYDIYLQDPRICHMNVKYSNPQRLSSDDPNSFPLVSEVIAQKLQWVRLHAIPELPDVLDMISSDLELEETPQPSAIKTCLQRHQKQALTFMLRREEERQFDSKQPNIWESINTDDRQFFFNRVSNVDQREEPQQFYGGIIADPMGLGKTLTMIALVATDLEGDNNAPYVVSDMDDVPSVSATLVIVPPPLLGTWEEQLAWHVHDGGLTFRRHHGKSRLAEVDVLDNCNIVLTTYHTVSSEWRAGRAVDLSALFSVRWKPHFIRNGNSHMAKAVCTLSAGSRWAVTGTPIQNHLSDLATLLRFIRVHPYNDPKRFDSDISRLWKSGEDDEAAKRLKRLSACVLLRRPKGTISLPPRQDLQYPVLFTKAERAVYDRIREKAITRLNEALDHDSELTRSGIYVNILQQIESLRLCCDLGLRYQTRHDTSAMRPSPRVYDWASAAQSAFNSRREMGAIVCLQCSSVIDLTETLLEDSTSKGGLQFSRCMKLACSECWHKLLQAGRPMDCGHNPPCPSAPVSLSSSAFEETPDEEVASPAAAESLILPSKVEALITDLMALPSDTKCLTLTVASRAYLMEPHWNPNLEEQALARIHRLGQTRDVTTVRFFMKDSIEEQVMRVQESKKHLASVLLSAHDGGQMDESLSGLEVRCQSKAHGAPTDVLLWF